MKRVLYIRAVVECPDGTYDPMLSLSDAATWAGCRLTHDDVNTDVVVYANAWDLALDEHEGVFA